MYQQVDRKCAFVQARKHVPLHQCLVFILAGLIGRVQSAASAERQSRLAEGPINAIERCGKHGLRKQHAVWLRPLARVVRPHVCRERGGKEILRHDQWVEHGRTRWPPHPPVQAPHVYHVPTFNNKPQRVSHECTGLPNACIWSVFVSLALIRCVWLV